MTDGRDLSREEEQEVTRLLAEAGGPVATPAEVVDRLDQVLAGLVADRDAPSADEGDASVDRPVVERSTATVHRLDAARDRPRRWPRVLLAAAAVVAGGYGVRAALPIGSGSDSGSSAESAGGGEGPTALDGGDTGASDREAGVSPRALADALAVLDAPLQLHSDRLGPEVRRVLRLPDATAGEAEDRAALRAARPCTPPSLAAGDTWYTVRFDGRPGTLVLSPVQEGRVEARVWACDGTLLAGTSVAAR